MLTPDQLLARLDALGIAHRTWHHEPFHTVEESEAAGADIPGAHIKNLFLKCEKGPLVLLTALHHARIDLKQLAPAIGLKRFSFGKPELLKEALGVTPGSVTPFALINDTVPRVRFLLDSAVFDHEHVAAHPLVNTATTVIATSDLLRFAHASGHSVEAYDTAQGQLRPERSRLL
jgi:Ala-tRNA(Pro) deacylase